MGNTLGSASSKAYIEQSYQNIYDQDATRPFRGKLKKKKKKVNREEIFHCYWDKQIHKKTKTGWGVRTAITKKTNDSKIWGDVGKEKPSFTAAGKNVNLYSHYGIHMEVSKKTLKIKPPCDPDIALLGIYLSL